VNTPLPLLPITSVPALSVVPAAIVYVPLIPVLVPNRNNPDTLTEFAL
jgi:hypothetical protein